MGFFAILFKYDPVNFADYILYNYHVLILIKFVLLFNILNILNYSESFESYLSTKLQVFFLLYNP